MSEDKANKEIKNETELIKVNKIVTDQEKRNGIEKEKQPINIEALREREVDVRPEKIESRSEEERIKTPSLIYSHGTSSADKARIREIENILAEGLEEIYINLPPSKQSEFKTAGEQTARQINSLLKEAKFKLNKIVNLIMKWLSLIPGVNRFFIEQEAKIKADEIVKFRNKE